VSAAPTTTAPALADEPGALTADNAEATLDELLGSLARVSINGGQQFEEKRRRFLTALRAALAAPAADNRNCRSVQKRLAVQQPAAASGAPAWAWATPDGERVVLQSAMETAQRTGGAPLSALRPFTVKLVPAAASGAGPQLSEAQIVAVWQGMPDRAAVCVAACEGIPTEKLQGKTIAEYVAGEAYLNGLAPGADGFNIGLSGIACQLFASSFAGQFKGSGAMNFLQVNMEHPEMGAFYVTIQRAEGKTPAQLKREAELERDVARAELAQLKAAAAAQAAPAAQPLTEVQVQDVMHLVAEYGLAAATGDIDFAEPERKEIEAALRGIGGAAGATGGATA
jgi:hypothetical protein